MGHDRLIVGKLVLVFNIYVVYPIARIPNATLPLTLAPCRMHTKQILPSSHILPVP